MKEMGREKIKREKTRREKEEENKRTEVDLKMRSKNIGRAGEDVGRERVEIENERGRKLYEIERN